jgi:hypothetical protein
MKRARKYPWMSAHDVRAQVFVHREVLSFNLISALKQPSVRSRCSTFQLWTSARWLADETQLAIKAVDTSVTASFWFDFCSLAAQQLVAVCFVPRLRWSWDLHCHVHLDCSAPFPGTHYFPSVWGKWPLFSTASQEVCCPVQADLISKSDPSERQSFTSAISWFLFKLGSVSLWLWRCR